MKLILSVDETAVLFSDLMCENGWRLNCIDRRPVPYEARNDIVKYHVAAKNGPGSAKMNMMATDKVSGNNSPQEHCGIVHSPRPNPCEDDQVPEH